MFASDSETTVQPPSFFDKQSNGTFLQTKLTIGQPGDIYEKEADAVAEKVVSSSPPSVQTKCAECEREESVQKQALPEEEELQMQPLNDEEELLQPQSLEEEEDLQMKPSLQFKDDGPSARRTEAGPEIHNKINNSRGSGRPLDSNTRNFMEIRMQKDFSSVQVHTGNEAVHMNRELGARAFTVGSDVYFNNGEYRPETTEGKKLLAHELTHTVQQGQSKKIQRQPVSIPALKEHGDLNQIPESVRRDCDIATSSSASEQQVPYSHSSSHLTPATSIVLNDFAREWHRRGANADVQIDGYASIEGPEPLNWRLSCARALTVKSGLTNPSDGTPGIPENFITIHAHGETNRFDLSTLAPNRLATITSTIPVNPNPPAPPAPPKPESKICGPDVSAEAAGVWRQIQSDFNSSSWSFGQKEAACRYLIQPVVPNPTTGSWGLNIDAFDTLGLFLNTAGWTQSAPYHPPCGVPGSSGDPCNNRDPLHEDPGRCSNTVKVGSGCWLTGTANYGTYGVMMRLCYDWLNSPLAILLMPTAVRLMLSQAFSYSSMVGLISAYKLYDRENPAWPVAWSSATYLGGPSSTPAGSNRPDCQPTCPVPFNAPAFDYVWEPTKRRPSSIPPQYEYPCSTPSP